VTATRILIVNADDFGRTPEINAGIARAHEQGIVTAATMMVRWPDAADAAAYASAHRELSVGLHVDLAEWEYTAYEWRPRYQVIDPDDAEAARLEVAAQLDAFLTLMGQPPTHIDSHQHVHRSEPVRSVVKAAGERLGVPVRDVTPGIRYSGDFYGQDGRGYPMPELITVDALLTLLAGLPEGVTELGCHPAVGSVDDVYGAERQIETATLCDARIRDAIERFDIELSSFAPLRATDP
jgi:predicted glycoside hydrolase/deacetylase ChbG (UPF0249 family)